MADQPCLDGTQIQAAEFLGNETLRYVFLHGRQGTVEETSLRRLLTLAVLERAWVEINSIPALCRAELGLRAGVEYTTSRELLSVNGKRASNANFTRMRCMGRARQSRGWPSANIGADAPCEVTAKWLGPLNDDQTVPLQAR